MPVLLWLESHSHDQGFQLMNDEEIIEFCSKQPAAYEEEQRSDEDEQELVVLPSNNEAFHCLETALTWFEGQEECDSKRLLCLKSGGGRQNHTWTFDYRDNSLSGSPPGKSGADNRGSTVFASGASSLENCSSSELDPCSPSNELGRSRRLDIARIAFVARGHPLFICRRRFTVARSSRGKFAIGSLVRSHLSGM
uniref:Uncharacterized protein n=1 Tax=Trichuris muris TaxID=70415 RepID=A0A5S6QT38_TRIMR